MLGAVAGECGGVRMKSIRCERRFRRRRSCSVRCLAGRRCLMRRDRRVRAACRDAHGIRRIAGAIASRMESDAHAADAHAADAHKTQDLHGDPPDPKRVNSVHLFAAVQRVLIWQCAIDHHHPAVVDYLRTQADGSIAIVRKSRQRKRPGRWHERKPKHPYARTI